MPSYLVQEIGLTRRDIVSGLQEDDDEEVFGAADGDDDVADRAVERAAGPDTEPARLVHHLDNVFQLAGGDSPSVSGTVTDGRLSFHSLVAFALCPLEDFVGFHI